MNPLQKAVLEHIKNAKASTFKELKADANVMLAAANHLGAENSRKIDACLQWLMRGNHIRYDWKDKRWKPVL